MYSQVTPHYINKICSKNANLRLFYYFYPLMRQTSKPLKRRQSKAFALRRQELSQKVDISTDGNQTENVSDFWNAATSKLNKDETVISQDSNLQSPAKSRLIKKSFDDEYLKELLNAEIDGVSESAIEGNSQNQDDESIINANRSAVGNVLDFFEQNEASASFINNDSQNKSFNKENIEIVEKEQSRPNKIVMNDRKSLRFDFQVAKTKIKEEEPVFSGFEESVQTDGSLISQPVSFIKNKDDLTYINDVNEIDNSKNQIAYLLQNQDIETSIIFLVQGAYVQKSVADKSFSLLVLKGRIGFTVDDKDIELRKHGLAIADRKSVV